MSGPLQQASPGDPQGETLVDVDEVTTQPHIAPGPAALPALRSHKTESAAESGRDRSEPGGTQMAQGNEKLK